MTLSTLSDLRDELAARGFGHLTPARLTRFINLGMTELCEQAPFPFLAVRSIGTAPITVSDFRLIESVETSEGVKLRPLDRRIVTDQDPGLDDTGSPTYYFFTGAGTTIDVWPANPSLTITVRYLKVPDALSDDDDVPAVPERYRMGIVDYAAGRAHAELGQHDQAAAARSEGDRTVAFMEASLIDPQVDGASMFVPLQGTDG
jgi:hypothetical protein